jgi:hypothetical protein
MMIRACAQPPQPIFKLSPRLARQRRIAESKRMDTFRVIHEALKETAKKEQAFLADIFKSRPEDTEDDEN